MLASAIHLVVVASCGESMVILRVHDCAFLFAFSSYGVSVVWMCGNKWLPLRNKNIFLNILCNNIFKTYSYIVNFKW
jgi:hypothetical protein